MNRGLLLLPLLCLTLVPTVQAEDLLAVFDRAVTNDPQIREAEANRMATREARPQAIASLLPQVSGSADKGRTWSDSRNTGSQLIGTTLFPNNTIVTSVNSTEGWNLNIRQSVFSWVNWVALKQASHQVAQAEADYVVAQQGLAQRVAQQYFAVLAAQDTVEALEAARDAFARQLDQADKRFEVGLIAITDVQEARAARDQAAAAVIAAKRALSNTQETLRATIGEKLDVLNKPAETMPLLTPSPASEDDWVKTSMENNASLLSSRLSADIARDQVHSAFGGHLPTLDLVAGRSYDKSDGNRFVNNSPSLNTSDGYGKSLSLQLSVPIFSGGATQSRVRQSQYYWIAAKERLERSSRDTERLARDAYLGVTSGISQVQAQRQALESRQTALRATEAGYEVGTRTAVDVLDARRALAQAQTDYAQSRYNYLNSLIQLRLASGDLDRSTIEEVNKWLTVVAPAPAPTPPPAQP
jgi:outer membrane protein